MCTSNGPVCQCKTSQFGGFPYSGDACQCSVVYCYDTSIPYNRDSSKVQMRERKDNLIIILPICASCIDEIWPKTMYTLFCQILEQIKKFIKSSILIGTSLNFLHNIRT